MSAGLVPLLHVTDLEGSIAFYEHLGLEPEGFFEQEGWLLWCRLRSETDAELMLTLTGDPPHVHDHGDQPLLYLVADDLDSLRDQLTDAGISAGAIEEQDGPGPRRELRIQDPDGYAWMVAERP